ncbi:Oligoribonuclease [Dactylella cylindrospora]|nr:Oligoribonuclease [Dactylella cylindrospora]
MIADAALSAIVPDGSSDEKTEKSLKSNNPLVWIDCEMSGLNPPKDKLLQVACYITDGQLNILEPDGFEIVISRPQSLLDGMDEWCTTTHASTGLTARVLSSTVSVSEAASQLLTYIKTHVPEPRTAIMCGNTIHFDKLFLTLEMPEVVEYFHYRIGDVSSIKEFAKRWCSEEFLKGLPEKTYTHEARQDILESIEEARYYKQKLFEKSGGEEESSFF